MEHDKRQHIVRLLPRQRGETAALPRPLSLRFIDRSERGVASSKPLSRMMIAKNVEVRESSTLQLFDSSLATGLFGKISSTLLIPMLFLQPLLPVYAADETIAPLAEMLAPSVEAAPATVTEVTTETAIESAPILTEEVPTESIPTAPTLPAEITTSPTQEVDSLEQSEETPPSLESEANEAPLAGGDDGLVDHSENTTPDPVVAVLPSSAEVISASPEEIISTDNEENAAVAEEVPPSDVIESAPVPVPPVVQAPIDEPATPTVDTPEEIVVDEATTTQDGISESGDVATTSEEELVANVPDEDSLVLDESVEEVSQQEVPQPTGPSPEELAEIARRQAEEARNQLKKEVAEEFLRGCISFEHTGYYCVKEDAAADELVVADDGIPTIFSEQGASGYKQIVVTKNGVRTELTHDNWDNTFPTQDISGEHFVWQGMKGGRWQIFFAEMVGTGSPRILQVTDSKESNFNPKVDGAHLVWQGWVDENWEIFFGTRRFEESPFASEHLPVGNKLLNVGPDWEVERLTTNQEHDMFPSLHGDIVTWQAREGDSWVIYAYSISQKTKTKLSSDGTKSENPRFAITWEERDEQGRTRLMSYDMSTGKKSNLTDEAKRVSGDPFQEGPVAPVSQPNQATLPVATSTATSTTARGDDEGAGTPTFTP